MASEQKYTTIKEYLDHLIAGRETLCVEFKYGKGGFPHKEFWPTYSSFANTDGGVIIIGAKERNGSGADTIVQGWDDAKFGTPVISEKSEPNKVELTLPIFSDGASNAESNAQSDGTSNGTSNEACNGTSNGACKGDSNGDSNGDRLGLKEIRELIANRKKVSYEHSCRIICELCHDWIGARELANTLGFSVSHIKSKILPRMIADGLLELYYKQSPKNPEQKYRAVSK